MEESGTKKNVGKIEEMGSPDLGLINCNQKWGTITWDNYLVYLIAEKFFRNIPDRIPGRQESDQGDRNDDE